MRICHTSDNHGYLTELPDEPFDLLVCTGDFLPSAPPKKSFGGRSLSPPGRKAEIMFQIDWMERMRERLLEWIDGKPFVWCPGNHDFMNPCHQLAIWGVTVYDTTDKWVEIDGVMFYGFPYINEIEGHWMFERDDQEMYHEVDDFMRMVKGRGKMPDVLLAHAPLHGVMDLAIDGHRYGNSYMLNQFMYGDMGKPKYYLCGHVHNKPEVQMLDGMLVSNAATTARIIEITV